MDAKIGQQTPKLAADGRPKPCCICLDEKKVRDECMFEHEDGMTKCQDLIAAHRKCMAGFGYKMAMTAYYYERTTKTKENFKAMNN